MQPWHDDFRAEMAHVWIPADAKCLITQASLQILPEVKTSAKVCDCFYSIATHHLKHLPYGLPATMVVPGDYNGAEGFLVHCDRRATTLPSWSVAMPVETKPLTAELGKHGTGILYWA